MKTVLFIIGYSIGGMERRIVNLFLRLHSAQPDQHCLIINAQLYAAMLRVGILNRDVRDITVLNQVPYSDRLPLNLNFRSNRAYYRHQIKKRNLAEATSFYLAGDARYLCGLFDGKHVVVGAYNVSRTPRSKELCFFQKATLVDALQPLIKGRLMRLGIDGEKIAVSPAPYATPPRIPVCAKKGRHLVFLGRLEAGKGVASFLEFARYCHGIPDDSFTFTIAGTGSLARYVEGYIARNHLTRVVYKGFCPNPFEVLCDADVFFSLQEQSNYPSQSLFEAMAAGCAVVATDTGDTKLLIDGEVGFVVRQPWKHSFTMVRDWLLNSDLAALGKAAQRRVSASCRNGMYDSYISGLLAGERR